MDGITPGIWAVAPFDAEPDKTIQSLLQSNVLPLPLPTCDGLTPNLGSTAGRDAVEDDYASLMPGWDTALQKATMPWSIGSDGLGSDQGQDQVPSYGPFVATSNGADIFHGDIIRPLGCTPSLQQGVDHESVSLEDIMALDQFRKDSQTPQLSPTTAISMSPCQTGAAALGNDRLSRYHSTIAAGHAEHLSHLVDSGRLGLAGHQDPRSLASSLSNAVLPAYPFGRPDVVNKTSSSTRSTNHTGMTIQQRRRMTLLAQRSNSVATRKRQMSAPGSCLPATTTSPEFKAANALPVASPRSAHVGIDPMSGIPGGRASHDGWSDAVLENSPDLVFVLSIKGTVLYMSPSCRRILGYVPEEIVGRPLIDFCHPADIGPFSRELKESTAVPAGEEDTAGVQGNTADRAAPKINLIMRLSLKGGGYNLIEATGSLSVDPPKHRKVVVCSGRPHPVPMLPWDHVRGDLCDPEPSAWLKLSHNGIFLGCTGPINTILGIEDVNLIGRHIRDLPMVDSSSDLLEALRSGRSISVQDWFRGASQKAPVKLTVYPWTLIGCSSAVAFVHVQQRPQPQEPQDTNQLPMKRKATDQSPSADVSTSARHGAGGLTGSVASPNGGVSRCMSRHDAASTVFAELTGFHNGSWLVEMQKLQNANKRLRHELQALTKRSAAKVASAVTVPAA